MRFKRKKCQFYTLLRNKISSKLLAKMNDESIPNWRTKWLNTGKMMFGNLKPGEVPKENSVFDSLGQITSNYILIWPKNLTCWENLRIFLHNLQIMYGSICYCLSRLMLSLTWLVGNCIGYHYCEQALSLSCHNYSVLIKIQLLYCSWFQPEMSRQFCEDILKKEVTMQTLIMLCAAKNVERFFLDFVFLKVSLC